MRQLQKTQRIAALAITGTLRTTPTDFIDAHAGILPIELALLKATHRATIRMLTLPDTHPLHSIVRSMREHPPTKHLGPIPSLLKTFKIDHEKFEVILPTALYTLRPPEFSTTIANTRKDSISFEKNDTADFKAYSDGSGFNDGVGAAAILYKKGRFTPINKLKIYLGPTTDHNTYEAELIGVILALWMIDKYPGTLGKKVSLFIDNQAVITSFANPKATSGQYLIRHINTIVNKLMCDLDVHWISSHSKVLGNEKVDELAKDAANGRSDSRMRLPPFLRNTLPVSTSATKQEFHQSLKKRWTKIWEASERSQRPVLADDTFPFNKFRRSTYQLTRNQASTIIQIRSGHFPLNGYLHKIGKADTFLCQSCNENNNVQCRETINHYLFECAAYEEARNDLANKIGRDNLNLLKIMKNTDHIRKLVSFVNRTGRFKQP